MRKEDLVKIAVAAALNADLDPALVCAICAHESEWDEYAMRYEPLFYSRYVSTMKNLSATEMTLRAMSFGLMQVMGQTAREQGFDEPNLARLCEPLNAVTQGCRKLKYCFESVAGARNAALLRYNGGGNANYPEAVMSYYNDYAYLNSATRRPQNA